MSWRSQESLGTLPNLAFVIPNLCHDTHNKGCPISVGDEWLSEQVPRMLRAVGPRGLVVLTWDEDDKKSSGNHILTIFSGPLVKPGYVATQPINHCTILRTLCEALGLTAFGAAASEAPITDVWLQEGNGSLVQAPSRP